MGASYVTGLVRGAGGRDEPLFLNLSEAHVSGLFVKHALIVMATC